MKAIFALGFCLLASSALAQEKELVVPNCPLTGRDFLNMSPQKQTTFSNGLVGGLFLSPLMGAPDMTSSQSRLVRLHSCVKSMTVAQVNTTIGKFVFEHPETMGTGVCTSAYRAIASSCNLGTN